MRLTAPAILVLTVGLGGGSLVARDQQQPAPPASARTMSTVAPQASVLQGLSGVWDYNAELSVDAATGRPEQAPRSAAARPVAPASGSSAPVRPPVTGGGGSGAPAGSSGTQSAQGTGRSEYDEARRAMALILAAERRTLLRDLLEVPEKLTIRATAESVSITDDLKRERNYTADGRKRKYMLSAAAFEASSGWQESAFRKVIEGPNNFRMTETYFLSEDGRRLFVIIRIGDPRRPEMMAGINRVYDRISSSSSY